MKLLLVMVAAVGFVAFLTSQSGGFRELFQKACETNPDVFPFCGEEDVNQDGVVNVLDLIDLLLCFGLPAVPGCEDEDVNTDGSVNVLDLIDLLLEFGLACP